MGELMAQFKRIEKMDKTKALTAGGQVIFDEMQIRTPVDSGALKASERMDVNGEEVVLSANQDYAEYVEFGTSRQAPQPYMRGAIEAKTDEALKVIASELDATIRRVV
jgi:HK97 gp10 family phage protein